MTHRLAPLVVALWLVVPVAGAIAQTGPTAPSAADAPASTPSESPAVPALSVPEPAAAPAVSAPEPAPAEAVVASAVLPHDLSPWGMFLQADIVVKAVMVGLALASLVTWTVWLAKSLQLIAARRAARRAGRVLAECDSLVHAAEQLGFGRGPVPRMVRAASTEARLSEGATGSLKERIASRLARIEADGGRRMMAGTGALATIGSTAPFVGLFGTVWGIMNAFVGISKAQTTNLAVVAPGIAEALLATAVGLIAAIPAVVIYNVFARQIAGYRALLADASAEIERLVSRDLDRHRPTRFKAAE